MASPRRRPLSAVRCLLAAFLVPVTRCLGCNAPPQAAGLAPSECRSFSEGVASDNAATPRTEEPPSFVQVAARAKRRHGDEAGGGGGPDQGATRLADAPQQSTSTRPEAQSSAPAEPANDELQHAAAAEARVAEELAMTATSRKVSLAEAAPNLGLQVKMRAIAQRADLGLGDAAESMVLLVTVGLLVVGSTCMALFCCDGDRPTKAGQAQSDGPVEDLCRRCCPLFWPATPPAAEMLVARRLPGRHGLFAPAQQRPMSGPRQSAGMPGMPGMPAGVPGSRLTTFRSTVPSLQAGQTPVVTADRGQAMSAPEAPDGLPQIYPPLVMSSAHTRLAVPADLFSKGEFNVDILGVSGVELLTASLVEQGGARRVEITLHPVGTLLAVVTERLELFGGSRNFFGRLVPEGDHYPLRDEGGLERLMVVPPRVDGAKLQVLTADPSGGRPMERGSAVRRAAREHLPAEHYEVVANPNVDAVLVLACFLAVAVFENRAPAAVAA